MVGWGGLLKFTNYYNLLYPKKKERKKERKEKYENKKKNQDIRSYDIFYEITGS